MPFTCSIEARRPEGALQAVVLGKPVVPEAGHDLGQQLEPVAPFVRDQNTKVSNLGFGHARSSV
jgi:hypothetical protein